MSAEIKYRVKARRHHRTGLPYQIVAVFNLQFIYAYLIYHKKMYSKKIYVLIWIIRIFYSSVVLYLIDNAKWRFKRIGNLDVFRRKRQKLCLSCISAEFLLMLQSKRRRLIQKAQILKLLRNFFHAVCLVRDPPHKKYGRLRTVSR